jgi:adenosylcobinamide-phosphate synthase
MDIALMLFMAVAIDLALGEPPRVMHPVVWIGKVTSSLERLAPHSGPRAQFLYGCGMVLVTIGLFTVPVYFLLIYLRSWSFVAYVIVGAMLLKSTFSLRELRRVALRIKRLLLARKLPEARFELRSLVSRDTQGLPQPLIVSATAESVAENTCDSFVAPLFYFLLLGIPGAIAYRATNTLDAIVGYRGKYEYLGKFASKLDDVLNFLPARLTGLLLVSAAFLSRRQAKTSWQVMVRDHSKTESPNAGWPMAALAGTLNVQLEKVGHYKLGKADASLGPETIDAALKVMQMAALVWASICFVVGVTCYAFAS